MAAANPDMTDEIKTFVVQQLAAFDTPSQVVEAVKQEFAVTMTPQAAQAYDPTKYAGRNMAAKWRTLFEKTRKSFIEDIGDIPIANKAMRLRALQRMASRAEGMKNFGLAARLHEQAAKEVGGAFTNKVDHTSSDRSMSPPTLADFYASMRQPKPEAEQDQS